jgi:hypothetical protein
MRCRSEQKNGGPSLFQGLCPNLPSPVAFVPQSPKTIRRNKAVHLADSIMWNPHTHLIPVLHISSGCLSLSENVTVGGSLEQCKGRLGFGVCSGEPAFTP